MVVANGPLASAIKVLSVVGSRADLKQVAPIMRAMAAHPGFAPRLVHTGEPEAAATSPVIGETPGFPIPDRHLGIVAASEVVETARVLIACEALLLADSPDLVLVAGDGNRALACALAATKLRIPVAHVEAGLRSRDFAAPEERNQRLIDRIARFLFTASADANENLLAEGHPPDRIHRVGSVRVDALRAERAAAEHSRILESLGHAPGTYAVLALRDPELGEDPERLAAALAAVASAGIEIPILYPVGPRARLLLPRQLDAELQVIEPPGELDSLQLLDQAAFVLTDLGEIQEATTALQVPCLTLRAETARPVTLREGSNLFVGLDPEKILEESRRILRGEGKQVQLPDLWDGRAAERIVAVLAGALRVPSIPAAAS